MSSHYLGSLFQLPSDSLPYACLSWYPIDGPKYVDNMRTNLSIYFCSRKQIWNKFGSSFWKWTILIYCYYVLVYYIIYPVVRWQMSISINYQRMDSRMAQEGERRIECTIREQQKCRTNQTLYVRYISMSLDAGQTRRWCPLSMNARCLRRRKMWITAILYCFFADSRSETKLTERNKTNGV